MEESLVARLLASETISGLIIDRIHWVSAPEGEPLPYLVLRIAAGNRQYNHDGPVDLQYPRIQFDSYGETYAEVKALSRAVLSEMEMPHEAEDVEFEDAILVLDQDMPKESLEGGTEVFRVTMDFMVPFRST